MLDYVGIFREFNKKKIKYIVAGGIAVNLHGIPRMTFDIDIILDLKDENVKKYCELLKRWEFKPKVPVDIMDFADAKKRNIWIKEKNVRAFCCFNQNWIIPQIDVLIDPKFSYNKCRKVRVFTNGVNIPIVSIDDLIRMKQNSNRQQDLSDAEYLLKVKNEKI